ncbi:MAG: tetratricopeptide repeat protein [Terriglobales bacterium]
MKSKSIYRVSCFLFLLGTRAILAQTYKIDQSTPDKANLSRPQQKPETKSLGWGSNIENARLARSAQQALKNGDYPAAVDYAQRAAQAAPGDAQLWFLLGYAARLAGKRTLAIDSYNRGLKIEPSSLDGQSGLAQAYYSAGQTSEAERILTSIVSSNSRRTDDMALLGEIQLRSEKYDEAISTLDKAEQSQSSSRIELLIASAYQHLKQFDRANHYLSLAKQHSPNDPEVARSFAGYYRETGNYKAAIASLQSIRNPNGDVIGELAYTYQLSGNPAESARLYAKAAHERPKDLNLQLSAAQAEVAAGAIEAARPFIDRAAQIDPDHYRLHAVRGEIARLEDRNEDAIREYRSAIERLPNDAPEGALYPIALRMNLVALEKSISNEDAAKRDLDVASAAIKGLDVHGPSRPEFLRLRALVNMENGDLPAADADLKEALSLGPDDPNNLQLSGDLFVKMGRTEDAIRLYQKVLETDPTNHLALASLGFASRTVGRDAEAEKYFRKLAEVEPRSYAAYLALGDLYTSRRDFAQAEASYRKAFAIAPKNSQIIAGAMNAAIEAKKFPVAGEWLSRATPEMQQNPQIMREAERYYSWTGDYQKSADIGHEVIKKLPNDRDVVVYLGYDLLHLEKYGELATLTSQYQDSLPKEPDIPLLKGYVDKHNGALDEAEKDFTEALARDPNVATAYVNRGFVRHDLHRPSEAQADFEIALKLEPKNGEAHLGMAYASLDSHQAKNALREVQIAKEELGDSMPVHLIRATAFGDLGKLKDAATEYRLALNFEPGNASLHLALADTLFGERLYSDAVTELHIAAKLSPNDPLIYASLARCYAELHDREAAMQNVQLAEQYVANQPQNQSTVYLSSGEALSTLGERNAAMDHFSKALDSSNRDSLRVRLAIAKLMVSSGQNDDARRQIALGIMEARAGETDPPTGAEWAQAADVFLAMHDYQLAENYYQRANDAGAPETSAKLGLANTYLAIGDTTRAEGEIASIRDSDATESSEYLMTKGNIFRQRHDNPQALTAFAQAANAAGDDDTAERELMQTAGDEGYRINSRLSLLSDFSVQPIFEDTTVYPLDAKLDVATPLPGKEALLPTPRSSLETQWTTAYHLHLDALPGAAGFFQVRNARGQISLPSSDSIINRDTTDYTFNFGLNPTFHIGNNVLTLSTGLQETIRRDSLDPVDMNQNLFRQFVYLSTSSFYNLVSVSGYAVRETGPFTEQDLHSRDLSAALDFRIGAPWAKTALITGWGARDEQFRPLIREFYYTSVYLGLEHRFSEKLRIRAEAEDLRAWRVQDLQYAIAQAIRPAGSIEYKPTRNWAIQGSVAYSRNMSFHAYDAVQSGFAVSYAMPFRREYRGEGSDVEVHYPIRFSAGMQQETFYNFPGQNSQQIRPYVSITLF